jgi:hypothetical protein
VKKLFAQEAARTLGVAQPLSCAIAMDALSEPLLNGEIKESGLMATAKGA